MLVAVVGVYAGVIGNRCDLECSKGFVTGNLDSLLETTVNDLFRTPWNFAVRDLIWVLDLPSNGIIEGSSRFGERPSGVDELFEIEMYSSASKPAAVSA